MPRTLYLVAYDICSNAQRLARVRRYFQSYRVSGQKSVPEIWVTPADLRTITVDMANLLDSATDRLQIIALDPRLQPQCLGQAVSFHTPYFCIT